MDLATYLPLYLGDLATSLNVSTNTINLIVSETLFIYGVVSEAEATDQKKLFALAKVEVWKYLMLQQTSNFDFNVDGGSYKTSQLYEFCKQNYLNALADAYQYLPQYKVKTKCFPISGSEVENVGI